MHCSITTLARIPIAQGNNFDLCQPTPELRELRRQLSQYIFDVHITRCDTVIYLFASLSTSQEVFQNDYNHIAVGVWSQLLAKSQQRRNKKSRCFTQDNPKKVCVPLSSPYIIGPNLAPDRSQFKLPPYQEIGTPYGNLRRKYSNCSGTIYCSLQTHRTTSPPS